MFIWLIARHVSTCIFPHAPKLKVFEMMHLSVRLLPSEVCLSVLTSWTHQDGYQLLTVYAYTNDTGISTRQHFGAVPHSGRVS